MMNDESPVQESTDHSSMQLEVMEGDLNGQCHH